MKLWKKVLIALIIIGAISGGSLYYYIKVVCNRPLDIASKAAVAVTADDFLNSCKTNKAHWDSTYLEKAVEISGTVKEVSTDTTLVIVGADSTAVINCLLQTPSKGIKAGDKTTVKGMCFGSDADLMSGSPIISINKAIVVKH